MVVETFDGAGNYYDLLLRFLNSGSCNEYYYSDCLGDDIGRACVYYMNRTISGSQSNFYTIVDYNPETT